MEIILLVKYIPQVHLNFTRKSTSGWNITNVLLDFMGGLLSLLQLCIDSYLNNDWSAIAGDPVKFGLGSASMIFDVIFMIQHYYLYPNQYQKVSNSNHSPHIDEKAYHIYHQVDEQAELPVV